MVSSRKMAVTTTLRQAFIFGYTSFISALTLFIPLHKLNTYQQISGRINK